MTSDARPLAGPVPGSAWQCPRPGQPRPLDAGTLTLVALPTSPFWARRYTRLFLDSCRGLSEDTAQTAELLVCELVTNAVVHAHTSVELCAARDDEGALRVDVFDRAIGGTVAPRQRGVDPASESGRGLAIVASLASSWGVDEAGNGKSVWFTLSTVP